MAPISVDPPVVTASTVGGARQLVVLDSATGALKKQITSSAGGSSALNLRPDGSSTGLTHYPIAVSGGRLYATTEGASGARFNQVVAIDLATGNVTWHASSSPVTRADVVEADDSGLLVYDEGSYEHLPRLVRFDLDTGKKHDGVSLPTDLRYKGYNALILVQGKKVIFNLFRSDPETPAIMAVGK